MPVEAKKKLTGLPEFKLRIKKSLPDYRKNDYYRKTTVLQLICATRKARVDFSVCVVVGPLFSGGVLRTHRIRHTPRDSNG